jgi:hypothetical protein
MHEGGADTGHGHGSVGGSYEATKALLHAALLEAGRLTR